MAVRKKHRKGSTLYRHRDNDFRPRPGGRFDVHIAIEERHSLLHTQDSIAGPLRAIAGIRCHAIRIEPDSVIPDS